MNQGDKDEAQLRGNKGVIFINIGSPAAPTAAALKPYLRKFLMDRFVIQLPLIPRWILVNLIIVPFRAKSSAEKYAAIWGPEGAPLIALSKRMDRAVSNLLPDFYVKTAMLNSEPTLETVLRECKAQGVSDVLCFPLFPQHAESTSIGSAEAFKGAVQKHYPDLKFRMHEEFFQDPGFITAWKTVILGKFGLPKSESAGTANLRSSSLIGAASVLPVDHILFSFHGLPESHLRKNRGCSIDTSTPGVIPECCKRADALTVDRCYRAQSFRTAERIAESLKLSVPWSVSFQSRLGRAAWIGPATESEIRRLAESGIRRLAVVGPSFIVDGLETLEEINIEMRKIFTDHGGRDFQFVSSLNASEPWVKFVADEVHKSFATPAF